MNHVEREIRLYQTTEGRVPFEEWVDDLRDNQLREKVYARIARVREGHFGDAKSVGDGVSELRIHFGPGFRIYFAQDGPRLVILLCGGEKSTQQKDIKNAKAYWSDYKGSKGRKKR